MKQKNYMCKFCKKTYVHEAVFLKHHCPVLSRLEKIKTVQGQQAWLAYQKWMRLTKHPILNESSYLNSKYFNAFLKFIAFAKKVNLSKSKRNIYIKSMIKKQIMPSSWATDDAYSWYIEYYDKTISPYEHFKDSIKTLLLMAEEYDCTVRDLFTTMPVTKLFELLRQRKISLWLLLHSTQFQVFSKTLCKSDITTFGELFNKTVWKVQLSKPENQDDIAKIKRIAEQMDL